MGLEAVNVIMMAITICRLLYCFILCCYCFELKIGVDTGRSQKFEEIKTWNMSFLNNHDFNLKVLQA